MNGYGHPTCNDTSTRRQPARSAMKHHRPRDADCGSRRSEVSCGNEPAERRDMPTPQRKRLGRYLVADPAICHGKPTFVGTRIMVVQVLKQVAKGMPWDAITAEWRGAVTREAI